MLMYISIIIANLLTLTKDVFVKGVVKFVPFFAALSARPMDLEASRRPSRDKAKFRTLSR